MSASRGRAADPSSGRTSLRPSFWPRRPDPDPGLEKAYRRSAWADAWHARPATLAVHLLTLVLAAWPAAALHRAVARAAGPAPVEQGVLVDLLRHGRQAGLPGAFLALLAAGAVLLVLSVPVQLAWIAALGGDRPRVALREGLRRTPMALLVSLTVGAAAVLAIALSCLPAYLLHAGYRGEPNARTHDLLVLAALAAPLAVALTASAWLDLARAATLRQGLGESLKRGWWALRGAGGTYGWVLLARAALGAPLLFVSLPPLAALVLLQLAALGSTFLRSRWLAEARIHVSARIPSNE